MIVRETRSLSSIPAGKPLLIMLPYAGGNSYTYNKIIDKLQKRFYILCPEIPGRGMLSAAPFIKNIDLLTDHLFSTWIKPLDLDRNYILFGHSMGALLAYLIAGRIHQEKCRLPIHLLISGRAAPSVKKEKAPIFNLPSEQFKMELQKIGGMPDEMLNDEELMGYFEPVLRADFEAVDTYQYVEPALLDIPITVFYGSNEDITPEEAAAWKIESSQEVYVRQMNGNHFFIFDHIDELASCLLGLIGHPTRINY